VQTLDGKSYEGEVFLELDNTVAVILKDSTRKKIALANVALAQFTTPLTRMSQFGRLAAGWTNMDIGDMSIAGLAGQSNRTIAIRVGGGNVTERHDALHYVYFPATGQVDVIARVLSIEGADRMARAGVMIRDSLKPDAKFALAAVNADGQVVMQTRGASPSRQRTDIAAPAEAGATTRLPCWLKISRQDNAFEASRSSDGKEWTPIGHAALTLREACFAGLFVASHSPLSVSTVVMDDVSRTIEGVWAEYFTDTDFSKLKTNRIDPAINFAWVNEPPVEGLNLSAFSVRWTGEVEPKYSELYTFYYDAHDAQLWVNGELVPQVPLRNQGREAAKLIRAVLLKAGNRYPFKFEDRQTGNPGIVRVGWSSQSQGKEPLPPKRLFCNIPAIASDEKPTAGIMPLAAKGILLRNGTFVSGSVKSMTEHSVKFTYRGDKEFSAPAHQVARIIFRASPRNSLLRQPTLTPGALLSSGDFVEGKVLLGNGRAAKISSVLFGLRTYNLDGGDLAALVMGDPLPAPTPYEIRLTDASVFMAKSIQVQAEEIEMDEPLLGTVRVPRELVAELRRTDIKRRLTRP
jgi:hypothetical protein